MEENHPWNVPPFEELFFIVESGFAGLRLPYRQWSDLARRAIQKLPYDARRLEQLEAEINQKRAALRRSILLASEHLTEEQLNQLRNRAQMSKYAWRSLKKSRPVTLKSGFTLVSY
jgi:hypothetical protein